MRKAKSMKQIKQEMANFKRKATREYKKKGFDEVVAKGKIETMLDVTKLFCGLSRKAIERAAMGEMLRLVSRNHTPQEIINIMEGKK